MGRLLANHGGRKRDVPSHGRNDMDGRANRTRSLPMATVRDTMAILAEVVTPVVGKGVIIRRPRMVGAAERFGLDDRAVRRMQRIRDSYGTGPLMLPVPLRAQAILLAPEHVHRVLEHSPEPFATASSEKRAALAHFEPKGVLISHGEARADRRRFNEAVLDHRREVHRMAEGFMRIVDDEAARLSDGARRRGGALDWDDFAVMWFRLVRRVIFGEGAAEDHELTDLSAQLRANANWAFLHPKQEHVRERFFERIDHHIARAEAGSLAEMIAAVPKTDTTEPAHQVPQWLFAFDPAGMTTFRALALLATHAAQADRVRQEASQAESRQHLPYARACVLESLRLWPTTPMVLRQTTQETVWENGVMPAGTGILIFAPFFHRDEERLPEAHRFSPELWLKERTSADWPLIPFSGGPAICPARNLVQMLSSAMLATLLQGHVVRVRQPERLDPEHLPGTLDNYTLRFELERSARPGLRVIPVRRVSGVRRV